MDSKEVFDKIEKALTKALNEEDGIMLDGKQIKVNRITDDMEEFANVCNKPKDPECVEICILEDSINLGMWHVSVFNAKYEISAAEYAVNELKREFGTSALVSKNDAIRYANSNAFGIAITF